MSEDEKKEKKNKVDITVEENFNVNVNMKIDNGRESDWHETDYPVREDAIEYKEDYWDIDNMEDAGYVKVVDNEIAQPIYEMFSKGMDIDGAVIVVSGGKRSGKTALCWEMFDHYAGERTLVVFGHPDKARVAQILTREKRSVHVIHDFNQILRNDNLYIWIDEPQMVFQDKALLAQFMAIMGQKNSTLLLSTCDTRYFSDDLEFHVDGWIVKKAYFKKAKRGSTIKDVVKPYQQFGEGTLIMERNEFIFWSWDVFREYNSFCPQFYTFTPPIWFDETLSKPFRDRQPQKPQRAAPEVYVTDQ